MKVIEGDRPSDGDRVHLKRTGEEGYIVHVFATYPFRGMSWFSSERAESRARRMRSRRRGGVKREVTQLLRDYSGRSIR